MYLYELKLFQYTSIRFTALPPREEILSNKVKDLVTLLKMHAIDFC